VSNDEQAEFAEFFQASWDPCLRAVMAVVGSPQLAEDQVAEAFARAWVVRTALNAGASWWRHRRELPLADSDLPGPRGPGEPGEPELGAGLDDVVLTALRRLPTRQREVIALRIFLDLDTGTIARQLGIEPGTARVHLSRAIAALRRELTLTMTTHRTTEAGS
jgi:RNA polymerase sigma factor (sigma-70 family)